jgi:hypothetical protein
MIPAVASLAFVIASRISVETLLVTVMTFLGAR